MKQDGGKNKQLGIVVRDADKTLGYYASLAFGENCRLLLDLIQPLGSGSVFHETLEQQGEGIQHAACWVPDLAKELAQLEPLGVKALMGNDCFVYLDTRGVGGLTIELMERQSA